MTTTTLHLDSGPVTLDEQGDPAGYPILLLHGGAGPRSVAGFAARLAPGSRVVTPTHPGFDGTPRPSTLDSMAGLAGLYRELVDALHLDGVTVVGNSIGGWIAAEMALHGNPHIAGVILVDAAGLVVDEDPVADFFALTMDQVADLSYARPDDFRIDVDALPDAQKQAMAGNRAALLAYAGSTMADPSLRERLGGVRVPTLVVWGAADRMIPPAHGRAYARAIPGARLHVIDGAGHLPQLEAPDELLELVRAFTAPKVSIVAPDGGEVALTGPIRMRLLEDGSATGHRLGVGEITLAPRTDGPPQHRHGRHDEGFYVVSGTARFTVGGSSYDAPAGSFVMVPPGAPHSFANPGDSPAVLLNTFTPDLYVQYFRELRALAEGGQPPAPARVVEVMSHYATTPAGPRIL